MLAAPVLKEKEQMSLAQQKAPQTVRFRARGPHYLDVLSALHKLLEPDWYLEIGAGRGNSLLRAPGKAISVDPTFRLRRDVMVDRPQLHLFRQTSDAFFASGVARTLVPAVDLTFIDGMHLFENVLRDFIQVEKLCRPDSTILLHDLVPFSPAAAAREWDVEATGGWSGDVWKMIPILRKYRPELDFTVLDPRPSGLGMVSGLDPHTTVLEEAYDQIVSDYIDLEYEDFGSDTLAALAGMVPVADVLDVQVASEDT